MQTDLLNKVAATTKRTEKEELLVQAQDETKDLLQLALDPMITFGVTLDEEKFKELRGQRRAVGLLGRKAIPKEKWWAEVFNLCAGLGNRVLTGHDAIGEIHRVLGVAPSDDDLLWAFRLINKDLRAGLGVATLVKVFPGLVVPFEVALAKPYDPDKHQIHGRYCLEPKLDGLRMMVIDGMAYTRNGHRITSVDHILSALPLSVAEGYVFDGEVKGAEFDETSGDVRQQRGTAESLVFNVFDVMERSEWKSKQTRPLWQRKEDLQLIQDVSINIQVVRWVELEEGEVTAARLLRARDIYMKHGFEGAMLKDMNAPYEFKRSTSMLKVKKMETVDGKIVGFEEGKGKCKGALGALRVKVDGVVTSVGGGYSDAQREDFWKHRNQLVGRTMEVQYQNFTKDGALRFPVFVKFRPDKE